MITHSSLFVGGMEWSIILFLAIILLLGTKRLPEFAKRVGKVMGEYQKARSEIQTELTKMNRPIDMSINNPLKTSINDPPIKVSTDGSRGVSEREKLETVARTLEIDPHGKTDDELRQLISNKMNQ
ncbi:MAG: twin-arginine translocase TatA/TatE family subunit [Nitrososphaerales archaeon]